MIKVLHLSATAAVLLVASFAAPTAAKAEVLVAGMAANMCLDVNQQNKRVILYGCHGGPNQNFFTSSYGQQRFGGLCLDQESDREDVALVMRACDSRRAAQKWALSSTGQLKNESGWCADIAHGDPSSGQKVVAYRCHGGANQVFGRGNYQRLGLAGHVSPGTLIDISGNAKRISASQVIASGGLNLLGHAGGNVIATGGGNAVRLNGGAVIASGGLN